jgi:hypothetical protein
MPPPPEDETGWLPRAGGEALAFGLLFALAYAALGLLFFHRTPLLFEHLDQLFDADLGLWTIDLARRQGPHTPTSVHPLFMLFFNPLGTALRGLLKLADVRLAARLAASLLCAIAGGASVGVFRVLLHRLGLAPGRARMWTLVFALSATQIVFSSLPESFAFSALSLILVFTVAAGARPRAVSRIAAGVFSFGVTVTNLGAVALARASAFEWRRETRRAAIATGRHLLVVLLVAAALGVAQWVLFPRARPFFLPEVPGAAYQRSFIRSASPSFLARRATAVASHVLFVGLAAPRVVAEKTDTRRVIVDFAPSPLLRPRWASGLHMVLWASLLALAARGLLRSAGPQGRLVGALVGWLALQSALHFVFGTSLFLYSGHWVFALVASAAVGLEAEASRSALRGRLVQVATLGLVALQVEANGSLVADVVRIYSRP